jgi:hypothetical protein
MADWNADADAYNAELATRRGAGPPATLGEIWNADWKAAGLDTLTGSGAPLADAFNTLVDAATEKLGPIPQAARAAGLDYFGAPGFDGKAHVIGQLVAALPKDQQADIAPLLDVRSRAADAAAKAESDAADVAGRTYGLSGTATGWLAGLARQVVDPANLLAMAVTGPEGGGIVTSLARQALTAGATQAIQEPVIQAHRAELGLESGFEPALKDIGEVAVGAPIASVGLGLAFRGAAWALRNARARPDVNVAPGDFEAAAMLADRDQVIAPAEPSHLEAITAALESGRDLVANLQASLPMTLPIVNVRNIALIAEEEGLRARNGQLESQLAGIPAGDFSAADRLNRLQAVEQQIATTTDATAKRALNERRDQILVDTTPEALQAGAAPIEARRRMQVEQASIASRLKEIADERAQSQLLPRQDPPNIGQVMAIPRPLTMMTGRPEVDAVLNEPPIRAAIENPKINDKNDVPYIAGASQGTDMTTNVDKHMPRQVDIDGVRFDPAIPANIHEQVEKTVMERMIAEKKTELGRELNPDELNTIYELAHHGYAEPAEDAWYRAHGVNVDKINRWWAEQDKITENENPKDPPPNLYKKPYPHDKVEGSKVPDPGAAEEWPTAAKPLSRRPTGSEVKAPAEPPEKPGAEKAGEQKATTLGNPQLTADAERALADAGGDLKIEVGEGTEARSVLARAALDQAKEDAAAARELEDCIGGGIQEAAE